MALSPKIAALKAQATSTWDRPVDSDTLEKMILAYYQGSMPNGQDERPTGGNLHIVTDDFNVRAGDILFCIRKAEEDGDADAVFIAEALLHFDQVERAKIAWGRGADA